MKYLRAIVIDVLFLGVFIAASVWGQFGFLNIAYFLGWLFTIMLLIGIVGAFSKKGKEIYNREKKIKSKLWYVYDITTDIVFTLLYAWHGWFILATIAGILYILKPGVRKYLEEQRVKKGAETC
ncbi:hypothetical protein [Serratia fonticola]